MPRHPSSDHREPVQRHEFGGRRRVRITSRKWDGSPHRDNHAIELGTDMHGRWLWMPEDERVITAAGSYRAVAGLRLFPPGETWWSAFFVPRHQRTGRAQQEYVDIATPAVLRADLIEFVDLDLDVERLDDGPVKVLDRDEFEERRVSMSYPSDVVERALRSAAAVRDLMAHRQPPFDGWWRRWRDFAVSSDG